jgi:hypothetical protein
MSLEEFGRIEAVILVGNKEYEISQLVIIDNHGIVQKNEHNGTGTSLS